MRVIFFVVLAVGVALAGTAVYIVQGFFSQQQAELRTAAERAAQVVPVVDVVTVKKALDYGSPVTEEHLIAIRWPANAVPDGFVTDLEAFLAEDKPRLALRRMERGEPLMDVKITNPGEDAGLGSRLKPGMRAFTIPVDATSGVSGFLRPDDTVDVYWTGDIGRDRSATRLIEAALNIIAVDQTANSDQSEARVARTVTVEATPTQIARLTQAKSSGRLTLSLVGHGDEIVSEAVEIDDRTFLGIEDEPEPEPEPVIAKAEPEPTCSIRTRRGADVVEIPIECRN